MRANWLSLVLAALSAAVAWLIARELLGHKQAFFAPVAAILTLGLTGGQRGRRALEVGVGVALGIAVADLLVIAIGTGAWQLAVVVGLAMVTAVLVGGGVMLVNQAAISAVLVVTLQAAAGGVSTARFLDALIGSAVALIANAVVPIDPLRIVRREAEPLLRELAATLEQVALALETHDLDEINAALRRARALDERTERLSTALDVGQETTVWAPTRRRARVELEPYAVALTSIDHAVRNTRVLARRALSAIEQDDRVPAAAFAAVRELASAIGELALDLADEYAPRSSRPSSCAPGPRDRRPRCHREPLREHDHRPGPRHRRRSAGRHRRSSRARPATPSAALARAPGSSHTASARP